MAKSKKVMNGVLLATLGVLFAIAGMFLLVNEDYYFVSIGLTLTGMIFALFGGFAIIKARNSKR